MYHIKDDYRTKRSAEKIYRSLLECMKKKLFEEITVTDITRACNMARTTFYRSFDNTVDILYWKCDESFHEVLDSYRPAVFGGEIDLARHYFSYWVTHYEILELLMKIGRQDIIYSCHMKNAEIINERYGLLRKISKKHPDYFMSARTGFTLGILAAWLDGGRKENAEELMQIVAEQIQTLKESAGF